MCNASATIICFDKDTSNKRIAQVQAYLQGAGFDSVRGKGGTKQIQVTAPGAQQPQVLPPAHSQVVSRMPGVRSIQEMPA